MKNIVRYIKAVAPHISIGFSVAFIVILVIDMFINDAMGFINTDVFKWMCLINCVTTVVSCSFLIARNRRDARRRAEKERNRAREL